MKTFFCYLTPGREGMHGNLTPEEGKVFGAHCEFLVKKFQEKKVFQAGTSFEPGEEGFAIVILEAPDKAAARKLIGEDPAVAKGLLNVRVTEYDVFLDRGQP